MFEVASREVSVCFRSFYWSLNTIRKLQSVQFPTYLIPRRYYSAAAASTEEPAHEESPAALGKHDRASQSSSRRGERLRKRLRARKAANAKLSTKKESRKLSWGSLKKPYPYSIIGGGKWKQFTYGSRHEFVPLGIDALGQPAKAVIVQLRDRVSKLKDEQVPPKNGDWVSGANALFENLSKEGNLLEPEEVFTTINQLKAPLTQKSHLTKLEWAGLRKKIRDSFQRDQLLQYVKLAREGALRSEERQIKSIKTEDSSQKIDHEHSKHKIAEYILSDIWGFVPGIQRSDDELSLSPDHFGVISHLKGKLLSELEEEYKVRIDLLPERTALKLHYNKEGDENQIFRNRERVYERLLQFCQDITARKIKLRTNIDSVSALWRRLLTKPYLDHISTENGVFAKLWPPEARRKAGRQLESGLEVQIHYPGRVYDPSLVMLAERALSLSFHWARQRSWIYQWWNKKSKLRPVHVEKPDSCTWHQQTQDWARLLPERAENEALSPQNLAKSLLNKISQGVENFRFPRGTFARDSVLFGHILTPNDPSEEMKKLPPGVVERKGLPPMSTKIPLLPQALSSFDARSNSSEESDLQLDKFLFVPSPLCEADLPSFEAVLSSTSTTRCSARVVRMSAIFLSMVIDVPLPQYSCDLRFERKYMCGLTPPNGFSALEWENNQYTKAISDRLRPLESLVAHLPDVWQEDKQQFSFPPLVDIAVPNAWVQRKGATAREPRSLDRAEAAEPNNDDPLSISAQVTQAPEVALQDGFYKGVPVANCESTRFTYLCAASGTVDKARFRRQSHQLSLDTSYDTVNNIQRQDLFLEGAKLEVRALGDRYGTQVGNRQVVKAFLAQALEYASNFGSEKREHVTVF